MEYKKLIQEKKEIEYFDDTNKVIIKGFVKADKLMIDEVTVYHNFNIKNIQNLSERVNEDLNKENALDKKWQIIESEEYRAEIFSQIFDKSQESYKAYKLIITPEDYSFSPIEYKKGRDAHGKKKGMQVSEKNLEKLIKTLLNNSKC